MSLDCVIYCAFLQHFVYGGRFFPDTVYNYVPDKSIRFYLHSFSAVVVVAASQICEIPRHSALWRYALLVRLARKEEQWYRSTGL